MAFSALLVFALALGVAAASPGPGIAALVSRVLTHGLRDVLPFLAWKMWFAPAGEEEGRLPSGQSPLRMFVAGLTVSASNPKIMVFYLALLPTLIDLSRVGVGAWLELTLTALTVLIAVDLTWALLAVRARRLLSGRRASRIANRASAAVMAGAAAAIATR